MVHSTYVDALQLQDKLIPSLASNIILKTEGTLAEIPDSFGSDEYIEKLTSIQEDLKSLPTGHAGATEFEDLVGDLIKMCFFRSLANVEPKCRDVGGVIVRDWSPVITPAADSGRC